jgi:hypothetical protein
MKNKQELVNRIIDFYLTGHNLKEAEAKAVISLKEEYKAINYTRCCTEFCPCGGNRRVALDCTMKPCKHPDYFKG